MPFLRSISSFGGSPFLINICQIWNPYIFYSLLFSLAFASADIIFQKYLKVHSAVTQKKICGTNFPFLTDSLKSPHPLNCQNPLSVTERFLSMIPQHIECSHNVKAMERCCFTSKPKIQIRPIVIGISFRLKSSSNINC